MYTNNALYFPHQHIPALQNIRGAEWQTLVKHIMQLPENHVDTSAFLLFIARLNGCLPCETDSYRAMHGCVPCAVQTLKRFRGTDADLLGMYQKAQADLQIFVNQRNTVREKQGYIEFT